MAFSHYANNNREIQYLHSPVSILSLALFSFNHPSMYLDDMVSLVLAYILVCSYSLVCLSLSWMHTAFAILVSTCLLAWFNI